jgi:hypothetical protein
MGFRKRFWAPTKMTTRVSNPVYTDTGIPVFGNPNTDTDTGKNWPVFAGICLYPILLVFTMQLASIGLILSHKLFLGRLKG